jgi:hypothetical protein
MTGGRIEDAGVVHDGERAQLPVSQAELLVQGRELLQGLQAVLIDGTFVGGQVAKEDAPSARTWLRSGDTPDFGAARPWRPPSENGRMNSWKCRVISVVFRMTIGLNYDVSWACSQRTGRTR